MVLRSPVVAARLLASEAAGRAAGLEPQAIGADSLLPLLVWVVAHAELPHAFSAVDFAKQLSTRDQARGLARWLRPGGCSVAAQWPLARLTAPSLDASLVPPWCLLDASLMPP